MPTATCAIWSIVSTSRTLCLPAELAHVTLQMPHAQVVVHALGCPLESCPKTLHAVRVRHAVPVLAYAVLDRFPVLQPVVTASLVRVQPHKPRSIGYCPRLEPGPQCCFAWYAETEWFAVPPSSRGRSSSARGAGPVLDALGAGLLSASAATRYQIPTRVGLNRLKSAETSSLPGKVATGGSPPATRLKPLWPGDFRMPGSGSE